MDLNLTTFIQVSAGETVWLDQLVLILASPLAYVAGLVVVTALFWPRWFGFTGSEPKAREVVSLALVSAFLARAVVKEVVVKLWDRARPFEVLPELRPILEHGLGASMPSGHAIFFFTVATVIVCYNRRFGGLLYVLAVVIFLARVAGGVHWLSDGLMGVGLGILFGLLAVGLYRKFRGEF